MKRLALSALFLLAACDDIGHVVVDRGDVCVDRAQVIDFKQTGQLHLKIKAKCEDACIANEEAFCEAAIDGPYIYLDSQFQWSVPEEQDCAMRCAEFAATCEVPSTHPGRYTLIHGDDQFTLDLPSNPLLDCLEPDVVE